MVEYLKLRCTKCGVEVDGGCNCGVGYMPVPAKEAAKKASILFPNLGNRAIADKINVDEGTVRKARKEISENPSQLRNNSATESKNPKRTGKDGKEYQARKQSAANRAREAWGVSVDISRVKTTPPVYVKLTEEMIKEYEKDLEIVSQIQMELIKFGVNADQLHPLRRLKYASQLKSQKDMWEMLAKNMIGKDGKNDKGESVNLRNVKSPHCNIDVPLFKEA
jgi:hypothetical protein